MKPYSLPGWKWDLNTKSRLKHDMIISCLIKRADFGDIHVGKLSGGWKPSMQANEYFNSIQTLKQWYADNKDEYIFVNEYDEVVSFDDYLIKIHEWNQDPENERHEYGPSADGFDWTYDEFA
jgi:hypothetical protein